MVSQLTAVLSSILPAWLGGDDFSSPYYNGKGRTTQPQRGHKGITRVAVRSHTNGVFFVQDGVGAYITAAADDDDDDDIDSNELEDVSTLFDFSQGFTAQGLEEEAQAGLLNRLEAIFVQYLGLSCYPDCLYIHSFLHAGPGQISFGDYRLDLIDATVVKAPGEIEFINFHEQNVHYKGHLKNSSLPKLGREEVKTCQRGKTKGRNNFFVFNSTSNKDETKFAYCLSINEAARKIGVQLKFTYVPVFECQIFHGDQNKSAIIKRLAKDFPKSFLPPHQKHISYDLMLKKLLYDKSMGGFAVISGGQDGQQNANLFGYCVTKQYPDPCEIGDYSKNLIKHLGHSNVESFCKRTALTVPRSNFLSSSYEVVSICYLRWLVEKRKLHGFKIIHVLAYTEMPLLRGFLEKLLQFRYDIKQKRIQGTSLQSLTCKLFVSFSLYT